MHQKTLSLFDLIPGKVLLDRYKIVRTNRRDGMSTTFVVEDLAADGERELQVFPASMFENREQSRDFVRVMQPWTKIASRTVLKAHSVHDLEDGTVLFVTDLPPAKSLREHGKERAPLPTAEVVKVGLELIEGLGAIHKAGLVHGDVKPNTIRVRDAKGHVELIDGGITASLWSAKHLGDKTALIGTPFYAPVEQFGGESPDVQSDVYNLACVLYELATGVLPWKGKSFLEVFQEKLLKDPPSMKSRAPKVVVPEALEQAIRGGLMADRGERYGDILPFRAALSAIKH
ncbi:MAG: serine/threonine-protein kinase [Planctomycetota bacterium]|nr:serine/threonine-protein kinase [Planctomycetota bacterium]